MAWTNETMSTDRLELRALGSEDRPLIERLLTDPDVRRFLGGPVEPLPDLDSQPFGERPGVWRVGVVADATAIGRVSISDQGRGVPELSYDLVPQAWGRGYAEEACRAALEWFWRSEPGADSVIAVTQAANGRSLRLLERLGFHEAEQFEEFGEVQSLQELAWRTPPTN